MSIASFESASNIFTFLNFTDLVAISAVVGPCFSFLATFYRIDPAETIPVDNRLNDTSITMSIASFESASNNFTVEVENDLIFYPRKGQS